MSTKVLGVLRAEDVPVVPWSSVARFQAILDRQERDQLVLARRERMLNARWRREGTIHTTMRTLARYKESAYYLALIYAMWMLGRWL